MSKRKVNLTNPHTGISTIYTSLNASKRFPCTLYSKVRIQRFNIRFLILSQWKYLLKLFRVWITLTYCSASNSHEYHPLEHRSAISTATFQPTKCHTDWTRPSQFHWISVGSPVFLVVVFWWKKKSRELYFWFVTAPNRILSPFNLQNRAHTLPYRTSKVDAREFNIQTSAKCCITSLPCASECESVCSVAALPLIVVRRVCVCSVCSCGVVAVWVVFRAVRVWLESVDVWIIFIISFKKKNSRWLRCDRGYSFSAKSTHTSRECAPRVTEILTTTTPPFWRSTKSHTKQHHQAAA